MDRAPRRILVVDDEAVQIRMIRGWYAGQPYTIFEAGDGPDGLRVAAETSPEIILLDMNMP